MPFSAKQFAGSHCGCRYQQDYRPTLGRDGKRNPARWRSSSSIMMEPSGSSSTATARRRPSCSASGRPAWTPTAPFTGPCPTAGRATTTRTICPKAGSRGRGREPLLRRLELPVEAGRRFRGGQTLGLPPLEGAAGKADREKQRMNCKNLGICAIHIDIVGILGYK